MNDKMLASTTSFPSLPNSTHHRHPLRRFTTTAACRSSEHSRELAALNDSPGNGTSMSGVLYKWVNFVRGWRRRWFILDDGVLSYYKLQAPQNLHVIPSDSNVVVHHSSTPLAQVHLMVCSVRESKSEERKFYVQTGTKNKLYLKAENKEDRARWVEAMMAAKDHMLPPPSSTSEVGVRFSADSVVVPTQRLRRRLLEEGVREEAIQDSENIMRTELSHILNRNHLLLLDTTENVGSENADIRSSRHYSKGDGNSYGTLLEIDSEGSASDRVGFFDTCDTLSPYSNSSNGSHHHHRHSSHDLEYEETSINGKVIAKYPYVRRRRKLPDPVEKETGVSLWSIIKDNIGKDLTRICLPVYFNEPLSSLQKCFEDLEYSYLLDQAYAWGKMGNSLMRMLHVAAFAVSGYACTDGRSCKPFNPLLGETYEAEYPDKGIRFVSEKVSHHPMILACHCEGRGWTIWGDSNLKSKFWGRSIHVDPVGVLTLKFHDGEVFQWSKVTTAIYNLILGKLSCDHYGTMKIEGNREYSCELRFKEQSIIDRNPRQVKGTVEHRKGETVATVFGKWDESLHYKIPENSGNGEEGSNASSKAHLLWKRSEPPEFQTKYNLTQFAITLNEITPGLREKLPPTDSRLRPDQRLLENGEYEMANAEKLRLEQRQRQARKMQENGWKPSWFAMDKSSHTYCYVGGYWEAREKGNWESCHDIFGQIPIETNLCPTS